MQRISLTLLAIVLSFSALAQTRHSNHETAKHLDIFNRLYKELDLNYVDTLAAKDVIEDAIYYMLEQLDPYTTYYPEDEQDDLRQMTTGKYAGVGSLISYHKGHDRCIISEPYANMPAAEVGLRCGDVILAIDDIEMPKCGKRNIRAYSDSVSTAMRGEPGTQLRIRVERYGEAKPLDFTITRRTIQLPTVDFCRMLNDSVGILSLSAFRENTAQEVRQAILNLKKQGMRRLLLDLRGNGGGLLGEAVQLVGLFVPLKSEVVSTRGKLAYKNQTFRTAALPLDQQMPLVVLTDFSTASAAEITAGALQDYDRAVIVGQRTYGKGLVQEPRELGGVGGGVLKVTTSKYYIPSGRCVQAYEFENGTPRHLPDSLSKVFHTKAGREVRDCGGIAPDIVVKEDSLPNLITYLMLSDLVGDYVARYRTTHPSIAAPEQFRLTDAEYADFIAFLKAEHFTYDRQSSHTLKLLRTIAEREGYAEQAKEQFEALESIFTRNEDYDYRLWEKQIRAVIEPAILTDYYYQRGAKEYDLRTNPTVARALEILCSDADYRSVLAPGR